MSVEYRTALQECLFIWPDRVFSHQILMDGASEFYRRDMTCILSGASVTCRRPHEVMSKNTSLCLMCWQCVYAFRM